MKNDSNACKDFSRVCHHIKSSICAISYYWGLVENGMSLDFKSADQVTTNKIGYFEAWNIAFFGLFKGNMTTSGSWWMEGSYQLFGKVGDIQEK